MFTHYIMSRILVFLLVLTGCQSDAETPSATRQAVPPFDVAWDERAIFGSGLIAAEQAMLDDVLPDASVYHLDLQVPADFSVLLGYEEVRYTNQETEPLDAVYFRLFPNIAGGSIAVDEVKVAGEDVAPVYESTDSAMRLDLPTPLQPGEHVVIQMEFEVEIPREMGGNYGLFGYFDDVLVLDEAYPVIPVYDDEGWNAETPPPNADVTYLDASFYVVRVTAPADVTLIASGVEVGRELQDDVQVLTFAAGPVRDFYMAASDKFTVVSDTVGETTVNSYAFTKQVEGADLALQYAVGALESFNARFGTYPYTEFDVVSTPMQALGMEYPGLVDIALMLYEPDATVSGLPASVILESTVAHEVAHQWFYNVVGNDQVDEPWVDEAVVQYVTGMYYLDTGGTGAYNAIRGSWEQRWDRVERADIPIGMPAGAYVDREYGAIVYGRGPLFVEALAEEMGQVTFDTFIRDYYETYKWGIGTATNFRALAEEHCECDLTPLFEAWVYE